MIIILNLLGCVYVPDYDLVNVLFALENIFATDDWMSCCSIQLFISSVSLQSLCLSPSIVRRKMLTSPNIIIKFSVLLFVSIIVYLKHFEVRLLAEYIIRILICSWELTLLSLVIHFLIPDKIPHCKLHYIKY